MVHPDQTGRLWPPCGPLHCIPQVRSTQPRCCAAGPLRTGWQLCHARRRLLPQQQRVREDRPPQLPGQAAASSQVPKPAQTEDAAAAQQTCGRTAESQTEGQAGGANYDHTYLAERLRQHQPAWQPTNGYGYDYDPWHVPEPRQARPRDLFSSPLVFPLAPPSFPTPAASPCAPAAPAQQHPTSFFSRKHLLSPSRQPSRQRRKPPACSRRICQPRRRRHACCGRSHQAPS